VTTPFLTVVRTVPRQAVTRPVLTSCRSPPTTHVHWPCNPVDGVVNLPPSARYVPGCHMIGRNFKRTTRRCVGDVYDGVMCRVTVVCRCSLRVYCLVAAVLTRDCSCWYSACTRRSFVCRSVLHPRHRSTDSPDSKWNSFHFVPGYICAISTGRQSLDKLICSGEVESSSAAQPGDARIH